MDDHAATEGESLPGNRVSGPKAPRLAPVVISVLLGLLVLGSIITSMRRGTGQSGEAGFAVGMQALNSGDWAVAEKELSAAAAANPEFVGAWVNLAMAQLANQDAVAAEASARHAIQLLDQGKTGPPIGLSARQLAAYAHGNLAVALAVQFRSAECAQEARTALSLDASNPRAESWKNLSRLDATSR